MTTNFSFSQSAFLTIEQALQQGIARHQAGQLQEAENLYRTILQAQPNHPDANHNLGVLAMQVKQTAAGLPFLKTALETNPNHDQYWLSYIDALIQTGQVETALMTLKQGRQRGLQGEAVNALAARLQNTEPDAQTLGRLITAFNAGHYLQAESLAREITTRFPQFGFAWKTLGTILHGRGGCAKEALKAKQTAVKLMPGDAEAHNNLGNLLQELTRYNEAEACYRQALLLEPDYAEAYYTLGRQLQELKRFDEAEACYRQVLSITPEYAGTHYNLGILYNHQNRYTEAIASYRHALSLKPDFAEAYNNLGNLLRDLKRYEEAEILFRQTLSLNPDYEFLYGLYLITKMAVCDWSNLEDHFSLLTAKIQKNEKVSQPFSITVIADSPPLQRKASEIYAQTKYPIRAEFRRIEKYPRREKIRIGYYSADYHNHATTYLMAELFENHDRSRFEMIAFSFSPNKTDEMRKRVAAAFDQFIDVSDQSDQAVALLSRKLGIDIAVDLKGFTTDARTGIFAFRAAPLQVNYLGYPGTMGAEYIDYLIADKTLIPDIHQKHYSEKIVYLPNSYQVNDSKRRISEKVFNRENFGLPSKSFVFCCFNNNYKITPDTFERWVRILKQVEGSVLWLLQDNPATTRNLIKEAEKRGIDANRLIFAMRMPLSEHLARHRLADLFLDTHPYNAHTTASDALWAGLPVLTCAGEAFASRVAASLLNAIHLPELVTSTQEDYERLAVELATHPDRLAKIKQKLANNRLTTPLFDTALFTKHIESAYVAMYERYQADLPPEHISL